MSEAEGTGERKPLKARAKCSSAPELYPSVLSLSPRPAAQRPSVLSPFFFLTTLCIFPLSRFPFSLGLFFFTPASLPLCFSPLSQPLPHCCFVFVFGPAHFPFCFTSFLLICHHLETKYIYLPAVFFVPVFSVLNLKAEEMKSSYFHILGVTKKLELKQ